MEANLRREGPSPASADFIQATLDGGDGDREEVCGKAALRQRRRR